MIPPYLGAWKIPDLGTEGGNFSDGGKIGGGGVQPWETLGNRARVSPVCDAPANDAPARERPGLGQKTGKMRWFLPPNGGKTAKGLGAGACVGHARVGVRGMPTAFQPLPPVEKVFTFPVGDRRPPFMREIFPTGFFTKAPWRAGRVPLPGGVPGRTGSGSRFQITRRRNGG